MNAVRQLVVTVLLIGVSLLAGSAALVLTVVTVNALFVVPVEVMAMVLLGGHLL